MSQTRLFDVAKVGCFLDGVAHSLEKRRGEDVKVLTLTLRVAPFTSQLATAMPDGVKTTLFKLNSGDPKDTLRRADFALGLERQLLKIAAAPDSEGTVAIDQVKVHGIYARTQKDRNGYDLILRATFGPVGRDELKFIQAWLLSQKFVTFEQAEPGMFEFETEDDDDLTDADEKARAAAPALGGLEDEPAKKPRRSAPKANRKLHTHQGKKKTGGRSARA